MQVLKIMLCLKARQIRKSSKLDYRMFEGAKPPLIAILSVRKQEKFDKFNP